MKNKWQLLGIGLFMAGLIVTVLNVFPATTKAVLEIPEVADLGLYELERDDGGYYTIVSEEGTVLDKTARQVYVGDELITADNKHYRISRIEDDTAYATLMGTREQLAPPSWGRIDLPVAGSASGAEKEKEEQAPLIGIYHTHSAESYVPSEGEAFVEAKGEQAQGGILNVGEVLSNALKEIGFRVTFDDTPHEPHDANAYYRSRRTAAQLLSEAPVAIIDVHRDAVPDPDFYRTELNGEEITKIRLVVGRQNQNMQANLEFAEQIKAAADESFPGLMHAIFMARGNYNQDLAPRSILIEAGTHVTSREEAERSMAFFAEVLPKALGVTPAPGERPASTEGDSKSVLWIIGLSLLAGGAFLLISAGSFSGAKEKLKQFIGEEWANFLGSKQKDKKAAGDREAAGEEKKTDEQQ